ncbi:MAG: flagellar biosynthetic protein FliO [Thiobacillaceae bacterium]
MNTPASNITNRSAPWRSGVRLSSSIAAVSLVFVPALAFGAASAPAPFANSAGNVVQVILGLLGVVILILALSWLTKRLGITQTFGNSPLKIVGSISLGGRERAVLIEVNDTWIVAGVATGQVHALATLAKGAMPTVLTDPSALGFASRFKSMIEKSRDGK